MSVCRKGKTRKSQYQFIQPGYTGAKRGFVCRFGKSSLWRKSLVFILLGFNDNSKWLKYLKIYFDWLERLSDVQIGNI